MINNRLADFLLFLHIIIFLFVTVTPFTNYDILILLNTVFMLGIFFHWIVNNNICVLTVIEKKLRGKEQDDQTFFGKLFGHVYTFGKNEKISWVILIGLILFSILKLIKNNTVGELIECLRQSHKGS